MAQDIPLTRADEAGEVLDEGLIEVAPDAAAKRLAIVNVAYLGAPGGPWVLIDAALPLTAGLIVRAAESRFATPPAAILLTHGHFDHVGALSALAERWQVPIYAHPLEHPYLDGRASYPPPDPAIGGGLMSRLSPLFPRGPIDVSAWLQPLPEDGSVPHLPGWRWLHTPGHSVGHVSLWRERDRMLLAADAFVTTAQESVYAAAVQAPSLHGPPMYYTQDWPSARRSVALLAALEPETAVCGHGHPMHGAALRYALHRLAADFDDRLAHPPAPLYERHPARAEDGTAYR